MSYIAEMTQIPKTTQLWRPVGKAELELIKEHGAFPPRLPGQPIFYPVCNEEYAVQIARDWNTKDAASGYEGHVTTFHVLTSFLADYEKRIVGGSNHEEYWIPAEDLEAFNQAIVGQVTVIMSFFGS